MKASAGNFNVQKKTSTSHLQLKGLIELNLKIFVNNLIILSIFVFDTCTLEKYIMADLISKVKDMMGLTRKAEKGVGTNANDQVDRLTNAVEQTNLETAEKSPYLVFEDLIEVWKEKGAAGDTCPRTLMHCKNERKN